MARKKPQSTKQKKAQLQEKRAIKRGDIPAPPPPTRTSLKDLLEALQQCHKELLEPPPHIRDNLEKHSSWKPRVRREVDWTALYRVDQENRPATSGTTRPDEAQAEDPAHEEEQVQKNEDDSDDDALDEPNGPLTVGLIGQPNVGKSSLLNALFGSIKVRASRTPGKTKHFQTLFWSPELRLVDCPGLVLPNLVPLELQVLSSIIPISRVSSIPSCIFNAGNLLPLERVFNLRHPSEDEPEAEDKRTWRGGMKPSTPSVAQKKWTAMDVLTAYANKKGWVTAKAGRPDVNRAGNAILRALAENRVPWAFEPPSSPSASTPTSAEDTEKSHDGIWLADSTSRIDETDAESEVDDGDTEDEDNKLTQSMKEANISEEEEEDDEEEEDWIDHTKPAKRKPTIVTSGGMFGALVEDDDEDEEESNEDEDGSEEE
ncbi:hypothetical protein FRC02_001135 [Tulasnella sp. 418]|nr:hypothetical protein FRC02_001135 [Tulasnella sp. 418]